MRTQKLPKTTKAQLVKRTSSGSFLAAAAQAKKTCILSAWALSVLEVGCAFAPFCHSKRINCFNLQASLDALTVKELRQLVKESVNERGVISKLKRKQDYIDFLENTKPRNGESEVEKQHVVSPKETQAPLGMPPHYPDQLLSPSTSKLPEPMPSESGVPSDKFIGGRNATTKHSLRTAAFEEVFNRYPPVRDSLWVNYSSPAGDVRQLYHPMLAALNTSSADMELIFVGTASCTPGATRGVSCTALRLNWRRRSFMWNPDDRRLETVEGFQGGTWIFDVGECTQLQIQQTTSIRPSKITKIFLTHAHGDHSFGLPGLLCLMGQDRDRDSPPVEIYGPEGLRTWLRVAIRYSVSRIVPPYRVHEILDVPMAPEWELAPRGRRYYYRGTGPSAEKRWGGKGLVGEDSESWITCAAKVKLEPSTSYGEIDGGRDIYPIYDHPLSSDGAPVWVVEDEEDVKVFAAPMSHGIPCLGYVVEEQPRPGRLKNEVVEPIVRRNADALKNAGFHVPMKAMAVIKNLAPGSFFTFPDGTIVTQEAAVEPPRQGRKIVLCGDTCSSRSLTKLALGADVVVHEATNCFLPGIDRDTSLRSVTKDAMLHGHSTPQIAGHFAKQVQARRLIMNHFSARYKGDPSVDSLSIMMRIEKRAITASGLDETTVAAAWDFMVVPIPNKMT